MIYQDSLFVVSQKWLGGWRVTDRRTGAQMVPSRDQTVRIGLLWKAIRHGRSTRMCPPGRLAEDILFEVFAHAVADPQSPPAELLLHGTVDDVALQIVREANRIASEDGLLRGRGGPIR